MKMVVAVSDWPETMGETFDIFQVQDGETDEAAIQRAKKAYNDGLDIYIEERI